MTSTANDFGRVSYLIDIIVAMVLRGGKLGQILSTIELLAFEVEAWDVEKGRYPGLTLVGQMSGVTPYDIFSGALIAGHNFGMINQARRTEIALRMADAIANKE